MRDEINLGLADIFLGKYNIFLLQFTLQLSNKKLRSDGWMVSAVSFSFLTPRSPGPVTVHESL